MVKLICVCSKSPNSILYDCIDSLYKIQVKDDTTYKICVVDSDSDDFTIYKKIEENFPDVELCFVKNKNYEYGAWKYILDKYPDCDSYFCTHDSILIKQYIDLDLLDDKTAYAFHNLSGYYSHMCIKDKGIQYLKDNGLDYFSKIDEPFNLAQHSSFIVNNKIMKDIFNTITIPPIDKEGSCICERTFGLYFIFNNINTIDLTNLFSKTMCGRT